METPSQRRAERAGAQALLPRLFNGAGYLLGLLRDWQNNCAALDLNHQMLAGFNENHVWFGGPDGLLYFTENGGEQWTQIFPRNENFWINGVWASSPSDVYVITSSLPGPGTIFRYH